MAGETTRIDDYCMHCGEQLAVTGERFEGLSVTGLRVLSYTHADSGERDCFIRRVAEPYDTFEATRAYEKARP